LKDKDLIFVKLGGAAITFKDKPSSANFEVLNQAAKEIAEVFNECNLLIGHGGGSFPHPVAAKYRVQEGLEVCGTEGFAETQRAAREINQLVVKSLQEQNLPAIPIQTSACTLMSNGQIKEMFTKPLEELIKKEMLPVIYGDVAVDTEKGCSIASTEMILRHLSEKLHPKRVIIATDVEGVYTADPKKDPNAELIREISQENLEEVLGMVSGASTTDVTGGMVHKVQSLFNLAKLGAEVEIISLLKPGLLKRSILGENGLGTTIRFK
jgi:isopentenyl phosphate kinase